MARKWRPRSFATIIGQDHVVKALTHALDTGRLHHAWLFTGTRGVGKTTLSRILAKSLNCEQGISSQPCGQCQACTEIDSGRFVDYIELDAASNRGVDEMTQLLEQAVYAPSAGRYKVYMIDEVHMLTGHAFNAMLKTLEEPPPHVKFILATTDPQKIPVTVLSRCLQFNLKQMTVPAIVGHLEQILQQEAVQSETPALRLIAQAAMGSMRDALSLTDQAIAYTSGVLNTDAVAQMLGTLDEHHLLNLVLALANSDAHAIKAVADEIQAMGMSFQAALGDLAILLSKVAIAQKLAYVSADEPLAADIQKLAKQLSADKLQLFYTVAVHSRKELALAPDEYAGFMMACLRMLTLMPQESEQQTVDVAITPAPVAEKKTITAIPVDTDVTTVKPAASKPDAIQGRQEVATNAITADAATADNTVQPDNTATQKFQINDLDPKKWVQLVRSLPLSGSAKSLALNSELQGVEENTIFVHVAIHTLAELNSQERLADAVKDYFGAGVNLKVEYGDTGTETVQAYTLAEQKRLQQQAEQAAHNHPLVQAIMDKFQAQIVPDSIRPS